VAAEPQTMITLPRSSQDGGRPLPSVSKELTVSDPPASASQSGANSQPTGRGKKPKNFLLRKIGETPVFKKTSQWLLELYRGVQPLLNFLKKFL
uniref:Uncharacterized protein n=1 Tax=Macaca fascicularis TaxID=9541 RepID=A0A7N9CPU3_MACFA